MCPQSGSAAAFTPDRPSNGMKTDAQCFKASLVVYLVPGQSCAIVTDTVGARNKLHGTCPASMDLHEGIVIAAEGPRSRETQRIAHPSKEERLGKS